MSGVRRFDGALVCVRTRSRHVKSRLIRSLSLPVLTQSKSRRTPNTWETSANHPASQGFGPHPFNLTTLARAPYSRNQNRPASGFSVKDRFYEYQNASLSRPGSGTGFSCWHDLLVPGDAAVKASASFVRSKEE